MVIEILVSKIVLIGIIVKIDFIEGKHLSVNIISLKIQDVKVKKIVNCIQIDLENRENQKLDIQEVHFLLVLVSLFNCRRRRS